MKKSGVTETKRVFIVDDEPSLRDLFSVALMDDSREILTCADGFSALRVLGESSFDVILLDLSLPDTNGIYILREMRRRGDFTKVILCSANVNEKAFVAALELGVTAFISKPVTLQALRETTQNVLEGETELNAGSPAEFAEKRRFSSYARELACNRSVPLRRSS